MEVMMGLFVTGLLCRIIGVTKNNQFFKISSICILVFSYFYLLFKSVKGW